MEAILETGYHSCYFLMKGEVQRPAELGAAAAYHLASAPGSPLPALLAIRQLAASPPAPHPRYSQEEAKL